MSKFFSKKKDQWKRPKPSFDDWLKKTNELLNEYMDEPVGEMFGSDKKKIKKASQKPNIEVQRKLKAELSTKHAAELKQKSTPKEEGDSGALARLRQAEIKEATDKKIDDLKRSKKRKRLRDAVIMAEILAKPVSKRK